MDDVDEIAAKLNEKLLESSRMKVLVDQLTQAEPGTLAAAYVMERNARDRCNDAKKKHQKRMDVIAGVIFGKLERHKVDSFRAEGHGPLVYQYTLTTAVCHDAEQFMQFVINNGEYDLLERRAALEACQNYADEHHQPPPGVTLNKFLKLGVRK